MAERHAKALAAVRAFVALLAAPGAREGGSALAAAYAMQRPTYGWPDVPFNVLGMLLRVAVTELGGRKLMSGGQIYEGVRIPPDWHMKAAA